MHSGNASSAPLWVRMQMSSTMLEEVMGIYSIKKIISLLTELKKIMVYLYNEILCSREIEELQPIMTTWLEVESIILSEVSQAVKEKYHMMSSISGTS